MEVIPPITPELTEKKWFRICRVALSIAMFIESVFISFLTSLFFIIGSLVLLLAGGIYGILALFPFGLIIVLPVFIAVNLLQRSRPKSTSVACVVLVILEGVALFKYGEGFRMYHLILPAIPFAGIFVSWNMKAGNPYQVIVKM